MTQRSRAERLQRARGNRRRTIARASVAAAVVTAIIAVGIGLSLRSERDGGADPTMSITTASVDVSRTLGDGVTTTATVPVEVPTLVGISMAEAELLVQAAGLRLSAVPTPPGDAAVGTVLAQEPGPGERVSAGSRVEVVFADPAAMAVGSGEGTQTATSHAGPVVCIDPGHQAAADMEPEPIGPGTSTTKPKVTGGAVGVVTRQPEHVLALALSLKVKERLERYGVGVVLTRTAANVDISNSQRAAVANTCGADLFVRIHADSSTNADQRGVSTLYPDGNDWVAPIRGESLKAAGIVHAEVLASTGAADRGVLDRADLAGFNYSTVPAILVEAGFLSNPIDDEQLSDAQYQDDLADGIARGILEYLGVTER